MAHPQNSPRGLFAKQAILVEEGVGILFGDYDTGSSALLTASASGLEVAGSVKISGQTLATISGDARGLSLSGSSILFSAPSDAIPSGVDRAATLWMVSNSTGFAVTVNTTGTTWKYLNTTDAQPT